MQDPRIRLLCACLLSVAAFVNQYAATTVFVWWLVFTPRFSCIRHRRALLAALLMFGLVALAIALSMGDGLSYLVRMTAILLIGAWLYTEFSPGDFLDLGTWLLGPKTGFELGMIAGMALQSADGLFEDFNRIRMAYAQKQVRWGVRFALPAGRVLVHDALRRADGMAGLLAVRGYRNGGTCCPHFKISIGDALAGACAVAILLIAFIPVSEFLYYTSEVLRG